MPRVKAVKDKAGTDLLLLLVFKIRGATSDFPMRLIGVLYNNGLEQIHASTFIPSSLLILIILTEFMVK